MEEYDESKKWYEIAICCPSICINPYVRKINLLFDPLTTIKRIPLYFVMKIATGPGRFYLVHTIHLISGPRLNTMCLRRRPDYAKKRHLAIFFDPSIYWQGVCKHLVDNAPSVGIVRCS